MIVKWVKAGALVYLALPVCKTAQIEDRVQRSIADFFAEGKVVFDRGYF